MATGYLHTLFESTPGNEVNTPTLGTKITYTPLITFAPALNPNPLERDDELRGVDEPIAVLPEAYDPTWSLNTRMYPDVAGTELKALLGPPTTTAGNGVITDPDAVAIPTGATRHVWTIPFGPSGINPQTTQRQAAYKDESVFFKLKGCATDTFSISSPATGGVQLQASGPALYMNRIADPSLSPTYESLTIPPFLRSQLTLTWLTGSSVTEDFTINVANPMSTVRTMSAASYFPDTVEKDAGPYVFSGSIPKRHIDQDDYDALLNSTGFAAKARWVSTVVIASGYKYSLWIQFLNCQYTGGGPDALQNARRLPASFDFKSTYSGTPGSTVVTLVNATASYV
jgi:hypothetical protein